MDKEVMSMRKRALLAIFLMGLVLFLSGCKTGENPIKQADDWIRKNIW